MILFFKGESAVIYALERNEKLGNELIERLSWLFGRARYLEGEFLQGYYLGPRKEMITPWSTNAVEITQNMGIPGIRRIEEFYEVSDANVAYDKMLQAVYQGLGQDVFRIDHKPEPVILIDDIAGYNQKEGLALSPEEIEYLDALSIRIGRKLTDSEVFGFSQVNSEHCRHKIFNGSFIIDGKEMEESLFQMIKKTSKINPKRIVSAYKDNVAFLEGPEIQVFAPARQDIPDLFRIMDIQSVISLKAETHNFPTSVEPFNGAATGSGGEIRDRMAGGKGSIPLAGTAVYMTSYPRLDASRKWEFAVPPRPWLYQTPEEILIKASNGASDFGNKFGQPLICGSVFTFEYADNQKIYGFDKVIMLAGGIGFARKEDSLKNEPCEGDKIIVLGGDNYRIGMGGGAVSSVATGEYGNQIELNAVQRSNPEMQKRVYNAIRAMTEADKNLIVSIHDHGAGGHLNSLSELVEVTGGQINMENLPIGDPTLSAKEIIGNESQERMGLLISGKDFETLKNVAERERAPLYQVGEVSSDHRLVFKNNLTKETAVDLNLVDLFGNPPRTVLIDNNLETSFSSLVYDTAFFHQYLEEVLQLEAVACKDWLTNKVDRSVMGRSALQQTAGPIQLPLNNLGISALDYQGIKGVATALGHAPAAGLIDPEAASRLAVSEALTNIIWAPIENGINGISLSANWMWPAKQKGEDARLYKAVKALSDYSIALGINVPTGKDSLSMTQKYPDGRQVLSPGTVIVSAAGEVINVRQAVKPVLVDVPSSYLFYLDLSDGNFYLGGSSFSQVISQLGNSTPDAADPDYFAKAFNAVQELILHDYILAGHDVSAGGLVTTLLELCFSRPSLGMDIDLTGLGEDDIIALLFSEKPSIIFQTSKLQEVTQLFKSKGVKFNVIGKPKTGDHLHIKTANESYHLDIKHLRDQWYKTSYLLDRKQCGDILALARFRNYREQMLHFTFNESFTGISSSYGINKNRRKPTNLKAAIIREKGVNGDREMAYSLYFAGFDVKDVHMTDLISGREDLQDINMIVFVGGFSNSDVLGSAKGWAGAFLYNEKAKEALEKFYLREDTLSLGICNGCQLMVELGLIYPDHESKPRMLVNKSHKFESAFLNVDIPSNQSVMFGSMSGQRLGVWVAHGEGQLRLPYDPDHYKIAAYYSYGEYPGNPNGSDYNAAAIASGDGRHLAMMPHIERSLFPWQWAYYPENRSNDEVSPWIEAFVNARDWIQDKVKI